MKICILSDIHGNYDALKKCLVEAKKNDAEIILCLGDYVGYYYEPEKCIDLLIKEKAICIKGNHENILLDLLKDKKKLPLFVSKYGNGINLALKKLKKKHVNFIKKLDDNKEIVIDNLRFLLSHGSPWDANLYIYPNKFKNYINKFNKYNYDFFLLGHTHIQMKKRIKNNTVLNPGSVGQPRDGDDLAKWAIIDTKTRKIFFKKTKFNSNSLIKKIKKYDPKNKKLIKYYL
jgi:putative phosphoesterase